MLLITGANGKLGRLVVEALLERGPADRIGVSVRNPDQAADLTARGVRVRRGDYGEPETLAKAFEGAEQVLIVSSNASGAEAVHHHRAALDAARTAGARHIFYTSHVGASETSAFPPMRDHFATERLLADAGVASTSLRNGFYASTVPMLLGDALTTGELLAPEDGPVSWTAHPDLAAATAILMGEDQRSASTTVALTAGEALDLTAVAAIASEVAGRSIRRVTVSDATFRDRLVARGLPTARADFMLGIFVASRRGDFEKVDPALARLISRPVISMRQFLTTALSAPARV